MQLNQIKLIGTLVRSPELRYFGTGTPATTFTVGGNRPIWDNNGEARELPFYQNVELIGEQAERITALAAGTGVVVRGRFYNQRWEDESGQRRSRTVVQGITVSLLEHEFETETDAKDGVRMIGGALNLGEVDGHLTDDADFSYTPGGHALTKFTVATNERRRDERGEWQERATFVDVVLWNHEAERFKELAKGTSVMVVGTLEVEVWQKDGNPRSNVVLHGAEVCVLRALPVTARRSFAPQPEGSSSATGASDPHAMPAHRASATGASGQRNRSASPAR